MHKFHLLKDGVNGPLMDEVRAKVNTWLREFFDEDDLMRVEDLVSFSFGSATIQVTVLPWHSGDVLVKVFSYLAENVDRQRGEHVHEESIVALRRLNGLGYGVDPGLPLDLVYNPIGPHLPPPQSNLESDYRRELGARYGVAFTRLITITNMPIGQFRGDLKRTGNLESYTELLERSFNPGPLDALMCRRQISVNWCCHGEFVDIRHGDSDCLLTRQSLTVRHFNDDFVDIVRVRVGRIFKVLSRCERQHSAA